MKMTGRDSLYPEFIFVPGDRLRAVDPEAVKRIAESFKEIGQQTPISVREDDDDPDSDRTILVAGLHRLEAAKLLGWEKIEVEWFQGGAAEARMWEIAENLHRSELTELERRQHIAEWVRLTAAKVLAEPTPLAGGQQPKDKAIRKAAEVLGLDPSTVSRAVAAEGLSDAAKQVADEAGLNTRERAKAAAEPTPEAQVEAVKREADKRAAAKEEAKKAKASRGTGPGAIRRRPELAPEPEVEPEVEPAAKLEVVFHQQTCPHCQGKGWIVGEAA